MNVSLFVLMSMAFLMLVSVLVLVLFLVVVLVVVFAIKFVSEFVVALALELIFTQKTSKSSINAIFRICICEISLISVGICFWTIVPM